MLSSRLRTGLEAALTFAERVSMYGRFPEFEKFLVRGDLDDALRLVRNVRLNDNQPIDLALRAPSALRRNEQLLLHLEAIVAELITLKKTEPVERPRQPRHNATTQTSRAYDTTVASN